MAMMSKQVAKKVSGQDWRYIISNVIYLRMKIDGLFEEVGDYYEELSLFLFHEADGIDIDYACYEEKIISLVKTLDKVENKCWQYLEKQINQGEQ
jgi:hypothetical protein